MNRPMFRVAVLILLLTTGISPGFAQTRKSVNWAAPNVTEKVKLGPKPMLRLVHIFTMHANRPDQPADVVIEKQLYSSHYLETAGDLTFLIRDIEQPKQSGFYGEGHEL